jgi:hypothetical protein
VARTERSAWKVVQFMWLIVFTSSACSTAASLVAQPRSCLHGARLFKVINGEHWTLTAKWRPISSPLETQHYSLRCLVNDLHRHRCTGRCSGLHLSYDQRSQGQTCSSMVRQEGFTTKDLRELDALIDPPTYWSGYGSCIGVSVYPRSCPQRMPALAHADKCCHDVPS